MLLAARDLYMRQTIVGDPANAIADRPLEAMADGRQNLWGGNRTLLHAG